MDFKVRRRIRKVVNRRNRPSRPPRVAPVAAWGHVDPSPARPITGIICGVTIERITAHTAGAPSACLGTGSVMRDGERHVAPRWGSKGWADGGAERGNGRLQASSAAGVLPKKESGNTTLSQYFDV